jgi:threonine/homoserine/homoserine lactone efflux protein
MFRSRYRLAHWGSGLRYNSFILGILATVFNPMFLLWWVTIGSMFIMRFREFGILGIMAFILAVEIPNLAWYPFVSIMTYRTQTFGWGQKSQPWILTAGSLLLVGFGIWFVVTGFK